MTAARQLRKSSLALGAMLGIAVSMGITAPLHGQAVGGPVVVDAKTGLAISGFDPVAYFVDGKPKFGRPDMELRVGATVWRFRNEGNRAAYTAHPEVYSPMFGGYDPVAIAHGNSVPGHPLFWSVTGERLYLFYSESARAEFLASPARIIEAATRKWPEVARTVTH
jgi:hypothetical protein